MDLNDKIKVILADKNLSPSLFADEIGIQRSSMSHILAGRNKPSLDIVQKIVKRFPELGTSWIMDDEDVPLIYVKSESDRTLQYPSMRGTKSNTAQSALPNSHPEPDQGQSSNVRDFPAELTMSVKKVDRVLFFYSDGTFEEFKKG